MTHKTLTQICAAIVFLDMAYMFYAGDSSTTWIVLFIFSALAMLFHKLSEQQEEIEMLRSQKETKQYDNDNKQSSKN